MSYLTIEVLGDGVVRTRLSENRWDDPCQCESPDFQGEDIHRDQRVTMKGVGLVRLVLGDHEEFYDNA